MCIREHLNECAVLVQVRDRLLNEGVGDGTRLHFLHADLLEVDFSGADIVFANSLMFPRKVLQHIANMARCMKPGSRIITDAEGESLALPGPGFQLVQKVTLPTTWRQYDGEATGGRFALQIVVGEN